MVDIPAAMFLPPAILETVVRYTPLVSIDLIVRDVSGRVLLGWRRNRPAKDCWFVPGGRINKGESVAAAFSRLAQVELGIALSADQARFVGVFEHFYPDCFSGTEISTHYVVLAYELQVGSLDVLPHDQHDRYTWLSPEDLLGNVQVHENTKAYFRSGPSRPR